MNLQQFLNIIRYRKKILLSVLLGLVSITMLVSVLLPKQYEAKVSVVIDQRTVDPLTGMIQPSQLMSAYMATQVDIIESHSVARKVVEKLRLAESPQVQEDYADANTTANIVDWLADLLLKKLEVTPSRESNLLEITYTAVSPEFSALVANAFADAYIQTSVELRAQPAKLNADWFDTQMQSLRQKLETAQAKLSDYQQQYGIVAIDDRLDIENSRLTDLSRLLVESQGRTDELESRRSLLGNNKGSESTDSMQEVLDSPLIQSLKAELAKTEANLEFLSKKYDRNHPQIKQVEAEAASLHQKINTEIRRVQNSMLSGLTSAKQRDEIFAKELAEQKAKVLELKKQRDEIAVLSHEVENAQRTFDTAMQRTVQTRMESELNHTNISILNPAIAPASASKPKLLLNFIISVFLGGMLGLGAALIAEMLDRRVRSVFDIAEALDLPVFAVITRSKFKVEQKYIQR
ncbi:chain length determinant protein EpsF [Methylomonas sp. AM2-LC]|uniref:chain length determinant protein EpsF n=1 Tax=Methylomonas sp. AM2-LC TaxID=3153301 RepID=UPI003266361E